MPEAPVTPHPTLCALVEELSSLGVRRVHSVAWRDLDDPDAGGSEVHADNIFQRWAAAGLEIHHRTSTADHRRVFERNGYRVTQAGSRYLVFPREILRRLFTRPDYDAVIEIWNGVPWFSSLWAKRPRVTWMHHIHTDMWKESLPTPLAPLGRLLEGTLAPPFYKRAPLITLAEPTREILLHNGYSPRLVHVVSPGIASEFSIDDSVAKTSHPSLIAVGRLAPVKQFDQLISLAIRVLHRIPTATLTIVGDGPEKARLNDLIVASGLTGRITLAGRVDQDALVTLYRQSWAVASASHSEGWGMTITEAAACGTPAVALTNDGHRAAISHDDSGLLAPTLVDLEHFVEKILNDRDLRERLSGGAYRRAKHFTWDNAAIATLEILRDEVLRRKRV